MFWLKSCPKCRGDLSEEVDSFGQYVACVQCGYYLTRLEEEVLGVHRYQPSIPKKKVLQSQRRPKSRRATLTRRLTSPRRAQKKN